MKYTAVNFLLGVLFLFQSLTAQTPDTLWTKTYGGDLWDVGELVQETRDGGYIIAGSTQSYGTGGSTDIWLIKTTASGDTQWTKSYGDIQVEYGKDVMQTSDHGYIISGYSVSEPRNLIIIKTDSLGDTLWAQYYGETGEAGYSVQQTFNGDYILGGYTGAAGPGERDFWLVRTDSLGDTLWTKTYGGNSWDFAFSARQTSDSGFVIVGYTESFGAGGKDYWLIKTDSMGDTIWTKTYGGIESDYGQDVQQTSEGGYIILGYSSSFGTGGSDIWLVKTDNKGDTLWTRTIGGPLSDVGFSIQQTVDGGYIIAGATGNNSVGRRDMLVIKTDSSGEPEWMGNYGGIYDDIGLSVRQTKDGGYIATGRTESFGDGTFNTPDVWLLRFAPDTAASVINFTEFRLGSFRLNQNYPNPFNPSTTIEFNLPKSEDATLKVYNILGKEIKILVSDKLNPGNHTYTFDGKNLASGIYYYQLVAGDFREVKKMILLR